MIAHDEPELAREELLYLVADCRAFFPAHNLLGDLAIAEDKLNVARGHFGFVYELTMQALGTNFHGRLPATRGYNQHFFQAGKSLARCLATLGNLDEAADLLRQLLKLDPREVELRELLDECELARRPGDAVVQLVSLQLPISPTALADNRDDDLADEEDDHDD